MDDGLWEFVFEQDDLVGEIDHFGRVVLGVLDVWDESLGEVVGIDGAWSESSTTALVTGRGLGSLLKFCFGGHELGECVALLRCGTLICQD